ncbi:MAG: hypothetical protein J3K34DRAFT_442738 [Monoraphidium minutum]|nr:MAG: hypothetical protein J3K34DRAFT_442738 [Monoraphidium minutum]
MPRRRCAAAAAAAPRAALAAFLPSILCHAYTAEAQISTARPAAAGPSHTAPRTEPAGRVGALRPCAGSAARPRSRVCARIASRNQTGRPAAAAAPRSMRGPLCAAAAMARIGRGAPPWRQLFVALCADQITLLLSVCTAAGGTCSLACTRARMHTQTRTARVNPPRRRHAASSSLGGRGLGIAQRRSGGPWQARRKQARCALRRPAAGRRRAVPPRLLPPAPCRRQSVHPARFGPGPLAQPAF